MSDPFGSDQIEVDLSAPDPSLEPGVDLWQVDEVKKTTAKRSGDPMLEMVLSRVRRSSDKIRDRIMLKGNGYDMGRQKLAAFLQPGFKGTLDLGNLKNVRVYANTEVTQFEGRSKLEVKARDGFPNGGYFPWVENGAMPPGYAAPSTDTVPF